METEMAIVNTKEALKSLRASAEIGDCDTRAVETLATELTRLRSLADRLIDAGVTRWHVPEEKVSLVEWLEVTESEYTEWVQRIGLFAGDANYNLDDDEAVMRGVVTVRKMLRMRVGDQAAHAQAFRDALNGY